MDDFSDLYSIPLIRDRCSIFFSFQVVGKSLSVSELFSLLFVMSVIATEVLTCFP